MIDSLRPDRIGHGILAAREPELMAALRDADITLEICPTSNLLTKAMRDEDEVRETFRAFVENAVPFTIATDGPEMMRTHLRDEFELLHAHRRARRERGAGRERAGSRGLVRRPSRHRRRVDPQIHPSGNGAARPCALVSSACRHSEIPQASHRGSGRSSS